MDAHRPWVLKEPRLCLLLPLLRPMLEVPVVVHVTREPLETASSLSTRNGFPMPVSVALWEHYTLQGLRASEGLPRYHVRHEDVLEDPVATFDALLDLLSEHGVHGLRRPSEREITAFVDPALNRHRQPGASAAACSTGTARPRRRGRRGHVVRRWVVDRRPRRRFDRAAEGVRVDARERIEELTAARVRTSCRSGELRHEASATPSVDSSSIEQRRLWQHSTERIRRPHSRR